MEALSFVIIITVATVAMLIVLSFISGTTKQKAGLKAYDILDNEAVRIAHRTHLNTVESSVVFLPALWMAAVYMSATVAAVVGGLWLCARIGYAYTYLKNPSKRTFFFASSLLMTVILAGNEFGVGVCVNMENKTKSLKGLFV